MTKALWVPTALLLIISQSAVAEIYKWIDENGEVQYSQQKPQSGQASSINVKPQPMLSSDSPEASSTGTSSAGIVQQCNGQESIEVGATLYCCTASCVVKMRKDNKQFTCATKQCYEGLIDADEVVRKERESKAQKDKRNAEIARERAESERNSERMKEEQRQIEEARKAGVQRQWENEQRQKMRY